MLYKSFLINIFSVLVSWKNGNNFGKITEFDSAIWLETLKIKCAPNICVASAGLTNRQDQFSCLNPALRGGGGVTNRLIGMFIILCSYENNNHFIRNLL